MHKQVLKCSNAQTSAQLQSIDVMSNAQVLKCQMLKCTNAQMPKPKPRVEKRWTLFSLALKHKVAFVHLWNLCICEICAFVKFAHLCILFDNFGCLSLFVQTTGVSAATLCHTAVTSRLPKPLAIAMASHTRTKLLHYWLVACYNQPKSSTKHGFGVSFKSWNTSRCTLDLCDVATWCGLVNTQILHF